MVLQLRILTVLWIIALMHLNLSNAQYTDEPYVAWHPVNDIVAISGISDVQLINPLSNTILNTLTGFSNISAAPIWSPDGEYLAIVSDSTGYIWYHPWLPIDAQNTHVLTNEFDAIYQASAWSSDGSFLALSWGSVIDIWNVQSSTMITRIDNGKVVGDLVWGPDPQSLFVVGGDAVVEFAIPSGSILRELILFSNDPTPDIYSAGTSVDLSLDDTTIIVGTIDGTVRFWNFEHTPLNSLTESKYFDDTVIQIAENRITEIAWHPTYPLFVTSSLDGKVYIYNIVSHTYNTIDVGTPVYSVAWSPDGTRLAYLGSTGIIELVTTPITPPMFNAGADQATTTTFITLDGSASSDPDGTIVSYSWSLDGTEIATGVSPQIELEVGMHTITLTVTDDDGATATDEVIVRVKK